METTMEELAPYMRGWRTYFGFCETPEVYRGRDSSLGFRTELENLVCDGKGKGTSGSPVRPKVPMRKPGADCSIGALIRGNSRGAKGAGHPH